MEHYNLPFILEKLYEIYFLAAVLFTIFKKGTDFLSKLRDINWKKQIVEE